ncbi:MAG: hypothetical protein U0990_06840 [Candidatus Nanopelagicales bacterium]|nr:hypothetical protein [Candidatus Nanopelagicales bacterium]MDZ4249792.1 hypothetical protein [Candidatus Nanopelagicales bacterium]MDZ7577204.1 hypothetical protein [Candidatus Nanopelagicales bacterium]
MGSKRTGIATLTVCVTLVLGACAPQTDTEPVREAGAPQTTQAPPLRDCTNVPKKPAADLSNCDLTGADLNNADNWTTQYAFGKNGTKFKWWGRIKVLGEGTRVRKIIVNPVHPTVLPDFPNFAGCQTKARWWTERDKFSGDSATVPCGELADQVRKFKFYPRRDVGETKLCASFSFPNSNPRKRWGWVQAVCVDIS